MATAVALAASAAMPMLASSQARDRRLASAVHCQVSSLWWCVNQSRELECFFPDVCFIAHSTLKRNWEIGGSPDASGSPSDLG